jgi:hypothetical protein
MAIRSYSDSLKEKQVATEWIICINLMVILTKAENSQIILSTSKIARGSSLTDYIIAESVLA